MREEGKAGHRPCVRPFVRSEETEGEAPTCRGGRTANRKSVFEATEHDRERRDKLLPAAAVVVVVATPKARPVREDVGISPEHEREVFFYRP